MPSQINFQSAANPTLSVVTMKGTSTTGTIAASGSGLIEFNGTSTSNHVYIKNGRLLPYLVSVSGGNYTCELNNYNSFHIETENAITGIIKLKNPIVGQSGHILIKNTGANPHNITWKVNIDNTDYTSYIKWQGGSAPTMSTTSGSYDIVSYYCYSTTEILLASSVGHS